MLLNRINLLGEIMTRSLKFDSIEKIEIFLRTNLNACLKSEDLDLTYEKGELVFTRKLDVNIKRTACGYQITKIKEKTVENPETLNALVTDLLEYFKGLK